MSEMEGLFPTFGMSDRDEPPVTPTMGKSPAVPVGDALPETAFAFHDLEDMLAGGTIEDPVRAEDGQLYDRKSIEAWFSACKKSKAYNYKIVSPHNTNKKMGNTLKPDAKMAQELQRRRDEVERGETPMGLPMKVPYKSIGMLSEVFEQLDRLVGSSAMRPRNGLAKDGTLRFPQFACEGGHLFANQNGIIDVGSQHRLGQSGVKLGAEIAQFLHRTKHGNAAPRRRLA